MPHSQASSASWSPASLTPDSGCHPAVPLSVLVPLFQGTSGRLLVDLGVIALEVGRTWHCFGKAAHCVTGEDSSRPAVTTAASQGKVMACVTAEHSDGGTVCSLPM